MKMQIVTQSGRPADPVKAKAFDSEWQALYDRAELKVSKIFAKPPNRLSGLDQMELLERHLRYAEHCLTKKYSALESIEVPTSAKKWAKLLERFDGPIMIARKLDGKLVLMKMDNLQS